MNPTAKPGDPRSGYAVLMIFCMAATVAILLYMQMPRVAFEAQRDKEQLLINHGKQYSRAIALYVRKWKRFPPTIDALENTNNVRFLRRRFVDPMTGKDEWRLIHVGPNGIFTDSLVYGKNDKKANGGAQTFITEMQQVGGNVASGTEGGVNLALRRRPSDAPGAPGTTDPNTAANPAPNNATQGPMQVLPDGRLVPVQIQNGMVMNAGVAPITAGQANALPPNAQTPVGMAATQQAQAGLLPGQPGPGAASPPAGNTAYPTDPNALNQNANGAPAGMQPGAPTGQAADLIRNLLTSPRAGGLGGTPVGNSTGPTPAATTTIGGGIGGVASSIKREGIKSFNERTAYNEWEFVYDMSKDPALTGAASAQTTAPAQPGLGNAAPGAPGQQPQQNGLGTNTPGGIPVNPGVPPVTPVPAPVPAPTTTSPPD